MSNIEIHGEKRDRERKKNSKKKIKKRDEKEREYFDKFLYRKNLSATLYIYLSILTGDLDSDGDSR